MFIKSYFFNFLVLFFFLSLPFSFANPNFKIITNLTEYKTNLLQLVTHLPPTWTICPVIKSDAYGRKMVDISKTALEVKGVKALCLVDTTEARVRHILIFLSFNF